MSDKTRKSGRIPGFLRSVAIAGLVLELGYLLSAYMPLDQHYLFAAVLLGFLSCDSTLWPRQSR